MADFTPLLMERDGVGRRVSTWRDYYDALWEGFVEVGQAPERPVFSEREKAELSATYATTEGLGFADARNVSTATVGTDPEYVDALDGYLYGCIANVLYRATSETGPWEVVRDFTGLTGDAGGKISAVRPLGDGEVLVGKGKDGLWKSSGWATNPLTASFAQVQAVATGARVLPFNLDTDPASGWAISTAYSTDPDKSGSSYVWLSQDNGTTWAVVHDLTVEHPTFDESLSHMHLAALDPYTGATPRLWISYHDTVDPPSLSRLRYSDDGGATWTDMSTTLKPFTACATEHGMVLGSDDVPKGVYRILRTDDPADMEIELPLRILNESNSLAIQSMKNITDERGNVHIAWRAYVAGIPAPVTSSDGYSASQVAQLDPVDSADVIVMDQLVAYDGRLLGVYNGTDGVRRYWRADLPKRGVQPADNDGALTGGSAGDGSVAVGQGAKGNGDNSVAVGFQASATSGSGTGAVAVGYTAQAVAQSVAIGRGVNASQARNVLAGELASSTATNAVALGWGATVTAASGTAIGANANAIGGVAIGSGAVGRSSVAIGVSATINHDNSTAIGRAATGNAGGTAIGRQASATHAGSVAIGYLATTTAANQFMIGDTDLESTRTGGGVVLKSPDGTRYKVTVANGGTITVAAA